MVGFGWKYEHGSRLLRWITGASQLVATGAVLKLVITFIKI